MERLDLSQNPFQVLTPEDMGAEDMHALFVPAISQFYNLRDEGHAIISGPRGCGKSMMLRYLRPDCQRLVHGKRLCEIANLAILVRIKNTVPNLTEWRRLDDHHSGVFLNEHAITLYVAKSVFKECQKATEDVDSGGKEAAQLYNDVFAPRLAIGGARNIPLLEETSSASIVFARMADVCDILYAQVNQYAKRLSPGSSTHVEYDGPLCDFTNLLLPMLRGIRELSSMPKGPILLLMDDGDYLNYTQTRVVNSWMAMRISSEVSIKLSTQLRYKTLQTLSNLPIQSPHDFHAVNIADVYTSSVGTYKSRVYDIIKKRLRAASIDVSPEHFFPDDQKQEAKIRAIGKEFKRKWNRGEGRGYRYSDDMTRYARPEYFKSLAGPAKSSSKYSYSGFNQLVHISSGIVRYFLEPAIAMFDEERARQKGKSVMSIRPSIQNDIIRAESDKLMFDQFNEILDAERTLSDSRMAEAALDDLSTRVFRLNNLLRALGGTFHEKLISEDAERRVFSVALSGSPDRTLVELLELGVRHGYFHRSTIGNKDGTGRTRLYVMTRRLAPHFNLDPTSFAGYLWVAAEQLLEAAENPDKMLRRVKRKGVASYFESAQLNLFSDD